MPGALSVIIVNFNTKDELRNCLSSIYESRQSTTYDVWVVDNHSSDSSAEMVEDEFPQAEVIKSEVNLGFSAANNLVLRRVQSDFILLLNPDTIVSDYIFDRMIEFLQTSLDAGMATCKLVKADGTLDLACRRSFPSVWDGFSRAVKLSTVFPKSRFFAGYNLTFLDENQTYEVDAINGAFMMAKREAVEEVGLLDEDYFMYMEDLDWCFRFKEKGWKIYYVPTAQVIHLKGRSGKQNSARMIRQFFKSMKWFCLKNYFHHRPGIQWWVTSLGITAWERMTLFQNTMRFEKRVTP